MELKLNIDVLQQPNDVTCGPTCLQALYNFYGNHVPLQRVIAEVPQLKTGGTLAVLLGVDALRRGYDATIYTNNLHEFDPTWFHPGRHELEERLRSQKAFKNNQRLQLATDAYLDFLEMGGDIRYRDFHAGMIRTYLAHGMPILTGLSATYMYDDAREYANSGCYDDVRGEPSGHFVVLCGYNRVDREILVADPRRNKYWMKADRIISAILLGVLTHDANLLMIRPKGSDARHAKRPRGKEAHRVPLCDAPVTVTPGD
jgi:hypothetical protein